MLNDKAHWTSTKNSFPNNLINTDCFSLSTKTIDSQNKSFFECFGNDYTGRNATDAAENCSIKVFGDNYNP